MDDVRRRLAAAPASALAERVCEYVQEHFGVAEVDLLLVDYRLSTLLALTRGEEMNEVRLPGNDPLGMFEGSRFTSQDFQLEPGDRLVIVSDGIHAARHNERGYAETDLRRLIRRTRTLTPLDMVRTTVNERCGLGDCRLITRPGPSHKEKAQHRVQPARDWVAPSRESFGSGSSRRDVRVANTTAGEGRGVKRRVAVATDLDSLALVLSVQPDDPDEEVLDAVNLSTAQNPAAVVVDLATGAGRRPNLVRALHQRRLHAAVPLLVVPLLAGTAPWSYHTVPAALASLPHAASPSEHRRTLSLPAAITAPAQARGLASEALRGWQLEDLLVSAELVVSELVSNAVMHAQTSVEVMVRRISTGIHISVRDGSPRPPRVAGHDPADVGHPRGRGLFLVSVTASRWGFLLGTADKVVWATIEK